MFSKLLINSYATSSSPTEANSHPWPERRLLHMLPMYPKVVIMYLRDWCPFLSLECLFHGVESSAFLGVHSIVPGRKGSLHKDLLSEWMNEYTIVFFFHISECWWYYYRVNKWRFPVWREKVGMVLIRVWVDSSVSDRQLCCASGFLQSLCVDLSSVLLPSSASVTWKSLSFFWPHGLVNAWDNKVRGLALHSQPCFWPDTM